MTRQALSQGFLVVSRDGKPAFCCPETLIELHARIPTRHPGRASDPDGVFASAFARSPGNRTADVTKGWGRSTERYLDLKGKLSVTRSSPRTDGDRTSDASDDGMAIATPDTSPRCMNSTTATWKLPFGYPHTSRTTVLVQPWTMLQHSSF